MALRLLPLLTLPNDGTKRGDRLDLRVALNIGAGHLAKSPNQKVLMLPVEAANVIGSIGGIAEIAREAFGGDNDGAARRGGSGVPRVKT